ncbi:MAG: ATP-binding protein, partial [Phycisphaerae bacterium]
LRNGIEAVRETGPGERRLILETSSAGSEAVMVAVSDNGCGCSEETAERLFDAFFTTKPDGMGMGLAISRSIIEAHGGRLWATPNPGGGTTFRFTLPVSQGGATS